MLVKKEEQNVNVGFENPIIKNPAEATCNTVRCNNGGTCLRTSGGRYVCQCTAGWRDPFCNTPIYQKSEADRISGEIKGKLTIVLYGLL